MAKTCAICGKQKQRGITRKLLRGHYNPTARRSFRPNLQAVRHEGTRVLACVSCIRSLSKTAKTK